ncbi:MAG: type II CAAX prenyl endopeptidase Rce1 family protein [Flavobacteriales bacterium Tduv]
MIPTEHISSLIPQDGLILGKMYKNMERLFEEQFRYPISMMVSVVFLAPVCEEIFFRGILLNGLLHNKTHPIKAILFSSFLFGAIHMNPWQFVGGMLIGSLLGLVYFCTRSISHCIMLHAFNNSFAALTLLYKKEYGSDPITEFLNANSWLFFLAFGLTVVSGYMLINQTKKHRENGLYHR